MGDRVWASIEIGGHINSFEALDDLVKAILDEGITCTETDIYLSTRQKVLKALHHCVSANKPVEFSGDEVNYGKFGAIDSVVEEYGLCSSTKYQAGGGFPEGITTITLDGREYNTATCEDDPVICLYELENAVGDESKPLKDVLLDIAQLMSYARSCSGRDLPKLTIEPHILAGSRMVAAE